MKVKDLLEFCKKNGACTPAVRWIRRHFHPGEPAYDVWRKCDRWEWLEWLVYTSTHTRLVSHITYERFLRTYGREDRNATKAPKANPEAAREYRKHVKWSDVRDAML